MRTTRTSFRRGNVAVIVAVLLIPLLGILAICIDGGMMMFNRRHLQSAADASALAAVIDLFTNWNTNYGYDPAGTAAQSARTTATANGFDGKTGNTVTVNIQNVAGTATYLAGQFKGQVLPKGFAEVIITYNQPPYFSAIWGSSTTQLSAHAVARTKWTAAEPGILLLDPNAKAALNATGNGSVVVTGGGSVVVDSTNADGGVITGNGSILAKSFYFSGQPGYDTTGSGQFDNINLTPPQPDPSVMHSNVPPTPDPLAGLPVPTMPATATLPDGSLATKQVNWSGNNQYGASNGVLTLSPGTYNGGIKVSGGSALILQPGIYYMNGGGFANTGSASISVSGPSSPDTGTGVLIYNNPLSSSDKITITGNGSVNIPAPTIGTYQGISIFQDRSSDAPVQITGNGNMNIGGTFYAAGATLQITGNGGTASGNPIDNIGAQYVSKDLVVTGNGSFNIDYAGQATPIRVIQLVE